jgi:eukaryotic-like serine/threonine-protein kinase
VEQVANCWQVKQCGREPGGLNVGNEGVCPAAIDKSCHGLNRGINGGRVCWAVAGTLCDGKPQGMFAIKIENCLKCEVFRRIADEEGSEFILRIDVRAAHAEKPFPFSLRLK